MNYRDRQVVVTGGSGFVSLRSVEGTVTLVGAKGKLDVNSVNSDVSVRDVAGDLQATVPAGSREPAQQNEMENSEGHPEDDQRKKKTVGAKSRNVLRPAHADREDQRDRQKTNTRQPLQPLP